MPTFEIAGDQSGRTFASLAEAQAAHQADEDEAWRRMKEGMRRDREAQARRGEVLAKERWEAQRDSLETLLAEARLGPGQAEAALQEAIAGGRLEDAVATALRMIALPAVFEATEAALTEHMAARLALSDADLAHSSGPVGAERSVST